MIRTLRLLSSSSAAGNEAARRIFGNLPISPVKTGLRVLRKPLVGPTLADYYPTPLEKYLKREFPGYQTPEQLRKKEKIDRLRKRGKAPPKKGEGKRSSKK
mmetsp:Transcript_53831/g.78623  ORF Transcript_53831/g.78623 Transcript_53831/m.78623 type:complete len:101 (-) Transcript_53831:567-869(-)